MIAQTSRSFFFQSLLKKVDKDKTAYEVRYSQKILFERKKKVYLTILKGRKKSDFMKHIGKSHPSHLCLSSLVQTK